MTYIVFKSPPEFHQITLEEFLFGADTINTDYTCKDRTATWTFDVKDTSKYHNLIDVERIIDILAAFNARTDELRSAERHSLYSEFYRPKRHGGLRKIDAPNPELMHAIRDLKFIFENYCSGSNQVLGSNHRTLALYHTAAFGYITGRGTVSCMRKHQQNNSRWFAKFDFSNFFGSINKEFTMKMFSMIFPFSEIVKNERGKQELETAIDLAFLDGVLPQGTPISPLITNIVMIPIDYRLSNAFRKFTWTSQDNEPKENKCIYTRYADDIQVTSKYSFSYKQVEQFIVQVLNEFGAPFSINKEKTRYGSSAGRNFNLGLMLGKENKLTIGREKKKNLLAMLSSYAKDKKSGVKWPLNDIQIMEGNRNYYIMVEGSDAVACIQHLSDKLGIDIVKAIKSDLRGE